MFRVQSRSIGSIRNSYRLLYSLQFASTVPNDTAHDQESLNDKLNTEHVDPIDKEDHVHKEAKYRATSSTENMDVSPITHPSVESQDSGTQITDDEEDQAVQRGGIDQGEEPAPKLFDGVLSRDDTPPHMVRSSQTSKLKVDPTNTNTVA